jgi:UDP-2,3-diacylglucosamine hydrolase
LQLFISDLHLSAREEDKVRLFLHFLKAIASQADTLYILGDLFDTWVGDDDQHPPIAVIKQALYQLSASGVRLLVMKGNRDFLLGEQFCLETCATMLDDPARIELYGVTTLLMHGDLLCTHDFEYQQMRQQVRSPDWINPFLSQPLERRLELANDYRAQSRETNTSKSDEIMDVTQEAVETYLKQFQATRLIHGHTHRPADHTFSLDGTTVTRHVLASWQGDQAEYLCATSEGIQRKTVFPG